MKRLCPFENQSIHHVYSKSIYRYEIFTSDEEYRRMIQLIQFYHYGGHSHPFSYYIDLKKNVLPLINSTSTIPLVKIYAYCLMSTHVHFILQQISDNGIAIFMRRLLNAYSKYFNLRHNRRGPLWENRFGNRIILDERGLNQRITYVLYNPVKENLVETPEQWPYSYHLNTGC